MLPSRRGDPSLFSLRSEEHTSELQSRSDLVCRVLLEKKVEHAGSNEKRAVEPVAILSETIEINVGGTPILPRVDKTDFCFEHGPMRTARYNLAVHDALLL